MSIFGRIRKIIDPLGYAKSQGMKVGKGVTLTGRNGTTFGSEPYLITLEDEVRMSGAIAFMTHDGGTWAFRDMDKYKDVLKFGRIKVGYRTFIGYGVKILPGVTIGSRCVIGAGAVVTKDIPDNSVAVGIPAKVICTTSEYAEKCLREHQQKGYDRKKLLENKKEYLLSMEMNE